MNKIDSIKKSRYLRVKETSQEKKLWKFLRNNRLGFKFRRQHPIDRFIMDFYCPEKKFCIEIDGSVHNKDSKEYDLSRQEFINSKGIQVIRFWNNEIDNDLTHVIEKIKKELLK
jgi:very-short-patch-repair endonuclease